MILYEEFETKTGGRLDALDVTQEVREAVERSGVRNGSVVVFSPHTTCCILTAPAGARTTAALEKLMEAVAPVGEYYAHDDLTIRTENLVEDEPPNAPAHIFHAFAGKASETIPIIDAKLALGDEQSVLFVELDCSRARRYCVQVIGE